MTKPLSPAATPETWVDRFGDMFYAYAYSRLHDADAAEEVVQETFLSGITGLHAYRGEGSSEGPWLTTILRRRIIDYLRRQDRKLSREIGVSLKDRNDNDSCAVPKIHSPSDSTGQPMRVASFNELWNKLHECLDGIPASQRNAFVLRELEELSPEEICKELDISTSNLWVRLHRARMRLAECIGPEWQQTTKPKPKQQEDSRV